jgi:uncharacterized protein (TIGR04255 family)
MNIDIKGLPTCITPDFIIDVSLEIRITSEIPQSSISAYALSILSKDYPTIRPAILQPQNIFAGMQLGTPQNSFATDLLLGNENFLVGIGKQVLLLSCVDGYKGWERFLPEIEHVLSMLNEKQPYFNSVIRIGLRYINLFPAPITLDDACENKLHFYNVDQYHQSIVNGAFEMHIGEYIAVVNMAKIAIANQLNKAPTAGSLLDIDFATKNAAGDTSISSVLRTICDLHQEEKKLFFSMLKEDFVNSHNPQYKG